MKKPKATLCYYCQTPTKARVTAGKITRLICIDEACWFKFFEEADA